MCLNYYNMYEEKNPYIYIALNLTSIKLFSIKKNVDM